MNIYIYIYIYIYIWDNLFKCFDLCLFLILLHKHIQLTFLRRNHSIQTFSCLIKWFINFQEKLRIFFAVFSSKKIVIAYFSINKNVIHSNIKFSNICIVLFFCSNILLNAIKTPSNACEVSSFIMFLTVRRDKTQFYNVFGCMVWQNSVILCFLLNGVTKLSSFMFLAVRGDKTQFYHVFDCTVWQNSVLSCFWLYGVTKLSFIMFLTVRCDKT